jgi:formylglycine-generating enzyme required for sulfatase activity
LGDKPYSVGPWSDVFAFGNTALEALFGTVKPTPKHWKQLPDELTGLLARCVDEEYDARNPSEGRFHGFGPILEGLVPAPAKPVAPPPPPAAVPPVAPKPAPPKPAEVVMPLVPAVPPPPPKPKAYQPGERIDIELVKGGAKMTFAYIPPGKFLMGSPESEKDRDSHETQHSVTLTRGFYMGVHPVTQAQYEAVTGTNPSQFKGDTLPVESVSWEDAVKFCNALSKKEGKTPCYMEGTWTTVPGADGYRLPTEAEWEYAARGMTTEEYLKLESEGKPTPPFYWGGELNGTQANCNGSNPYGTAATDPPRYLGKTSPVGNYADKAPEKHPWGLCDVHGNVWEWCADW